MFPLGCLCCLFRCHDVTVWTDSTILLILFITSRTQVKYTQGGLENLELARKYFAQALRLNNRNMRALFGLYMVSAARKKARSREKMWNQKQFNHFWNCGLSRLRLTTEYVKQDCTCVEWGRGSQTGQSVADSDGELQNWGSFSPQELFLALYCRNNTSLVRLSGVSDLYQ